METCEICHTVREPPTTYRTLGVLRIALIFTLYSLGSLALRLGSWDFDLTFECFSLKAPAPRRTGKPTQTSEQAS
jgi:hypothetical protein